MLAKIHVAKKQLNMVDDDYRQLLFATTGKTSSADCNQAQLAAVIKALEGKGFRPMPAGGKAPSAQHKVARKARALWISLYQLGAVHNPAEEALEAFAKRQFGCDKLQWIKQSDGYLLIEALKSMARRAGWLQEQIGTRKKLTPTELQSGLCHTIVAKLKEAGAIPSDWGLHDAAWKLCGVANTKETPWTADDYQRLAAGLGAELRKFAPKGGAL
jgi:phage gp16-like protein